MKPTVTLRYLYSVEQLRCVLLCEQKERKLNILTGLTKELWRSNREVNHGKSREIAGNHRKFHSKNNGDHFFLNRDGSHRRGPSKKQW